MLCDERDEIVVRRFAFAREKKYRLQEQQLSDADVFRVQTRARADAARDPRMVPSATFRLCATTHASSRGCFVAPRATRDSPGRIFRRVPPPVRKSARSFSGRRSPAARASAAREGSHPDDELDVFGFTEQWEVDMVRFWRDWNDASERHRVRDLDIKWLVALGRTDDSFSRVDVVEAGAVSYTHLRAHET